MTLTDYYDYQWSSGSLTDYKSAIYWLLDSVMHHTHTTGSWSWLIAYTQMEDCHRLITWSIKTAQTHTVLLSLVKLYSEHCVAFSLFCLAVLIDPSFVLFVYSCLLSAFLTIFLFIDHNSGFPVYICLLLCCHCLPAHSAKLTCVWIHIPVVSVTSLLHRHIHIFVFSIKVLSKMTKISPKSYLPLCCFFHLQLSRRIK